MMRCVGNLKVRVGLLNFKNRFFFGKFNHDVVNDQLCSLQEPEAMTTSGRFEVQDYKPHGDIYL